MTASVYLYNIGGREIAMTNKMKYLENYITSKVARKHCYIQAAIVAIVNVE